MSLPYMFWIFFRIAAFTLGGGYAILPVMRDEFVAKRKLLNDEVFHEYLSLVQGMPGSLAVNCSVLIGYHLRGIIGALTGVFASILPSFIIITLISAFFFQQGASPYVEKFFSGVRPGVIALILYFGFDMIKKTRWKFSKIILFGIFFFLFMVFRINPILLILGAAILGLFNAWYIDKKESS